MGSLDKLVNELLKGKEITLINNRYNDGTKKKPDIIIDRVCAKVMEDVSCNKDIVVYLNKENDNVIFDIHEVYRMPYIKNKNVLKSVLSEVKKQSHYF